MRALWPYINSSDAIQKKEIDSFTEKKEIDLESGPITALACLIHALPDDLLSAYAPDTETNVKVV